MMKKSITLFLFFVGIVSAIQSQNATKSHLTLDYGPGYMMRQNTSLSSLIYKNWSGINGRLSYWKQGKYIHGVHFRMTNFRLFTNEPFTFYFDEAHEEGYETFKHSFTSADFAYWLGKEFINNSPFSLKAGLREMNNLQIGDYANITDTNFGYNFTFTLDSWIEANVKVNEDHTFYSRLAFQLFGFQARSPYLGQNAAYFENAQSRKPIPTVLEYIKDGRWASWESMQNLDLELGYRYSISKRLDLGFNYSFYANFSQNPRPFTSIVSNFYLSTSFKF